MKVTIVGGAGRVGLPFGLVLAEQGHHVTAFDTNLQAVETINNGDMPFLEAGAPEILTRARSNGNFLATSDPDSVLGAEVVVVVVGTPFDEHLNPDPGAVEQILADLSPFFHSGQLLILRSTVFPGVTRKVEEWFTSHHPGVAVVFCPERIAEGFALEEIPTLPQLVGARTETIAKQACSFFDSIGVRSIVVEPEEAELAKLFTNTWRYIKFAAANQFWVVANEFDVDFERVRSAITTDYPRAADLPGAGFAGGPCLLKDTMQLSTLTGNVFPLGNAAMLVNEGLPLYLIQRLGQKFDLRSSTIGILGMAFKRDVDDIRSSLSYKLRKLLSFQAERVLCSDPYVNDDRLVSQDQVLDESDLVIIATPHTCYKSIEFRQPLVDLWNLYGQGVRI